MLTVKFCKFTPVLNILIQLIPQLSKQHLFRVSIKDQYFQHSDVYTAGWTQTAPLQFLPGTGKPQGLETKVAVMEKHLKSAGLTLRGSPFLFRIPAQESTNWSPSEVPSAGGWYG